MSAREKSQESPGQDQNQISIGSSDLGLSIPDQCPNCGKKNTFVLDSGELVCSNCGFVLREKIEETTPEWRTFATSPGDESPARAGSPTDLAKHDMGLSTVIGSEDVDAKGRAFNSSMRSTFERLRTWDSRLKVHTSQERDLRKAFRDLGITSQKMNLSISIVEKAAYIYRKAFERKLIRGRTISGMIAAALYAAIRETDTPRPIKDVAEASAVDLSDIRRNYRVIVKELDLRMPVLDPRRLVSRISKRVGVKDRTELRAVDLVRQAEEAGIASGKEPMGVAAAAVYLASLLESDRKTEKEISAASGLSEVSIRHTYSQMKSGLKISLDQK
jgi:transcription initiation factor TFIIB